MFLNIWITSKNRTKAFVTKSAYAGCLMSVMLSPSNISCSSVNALTFEEWSSVITARTSNPTSAKSSVHLLISQTFQPFASDFCFRKGAYHYWGRLFQGDNQEKYHSVEQIPFILSHEITTVGGIVQIFVNTFHRWLKHNHWTRAVFLEVIWQLSANQFQQMTLHSPFSFIYDAKFSTMLNLVTVQFCPWRNHSGSGITSFVRQRDM